MRALVLLAFSLGLAHADKPRMVSGALSAPATSKPQLIARDYLQQVPDLVRVPLSELAPPRVDAAANSGGFIVRYRQQHQGLPVIGAGVTVRVDARGRVVRAGATTVEIG